MCLTGIFVPQHQPLLFLFPVKEGLSCNFQTTCVATGKAVYLARDGCTSASTTAVSVPCWWRLVMQFADYSYSYWKGSVPQHQPLLFLFPVNEGLSCNNVNTIIFFKPFLSILKVLNTNLSSGTLSPDHWHIYNCKNRHKSFCYAIFRLLV